jgi:hypothetical protein|tara:strand:- start:292 stop:678 length:387 start_codon:yes stop_codon:yes gene_type:complete
MKAKNSVLFFILFFCFLTFIANAEGYLCSYKFGDKTHQLSLYKDSENSYILDQDYKTQEFVLGEDDQTLMLGNKFDTKRSGMGIRVIFVDKILKRFTLTVLVNPIARVDYKNGIWGDIKGQCEELKYF